MSNTAAKTSRTYRVRVVDSKGFLHTHDIDATSARKARSVAFRATNEETRNASYTYDVHGVTNNGDFGVLYFLHDFATN